MFLQEFGIFSLLHTCSMKAMQNILLFRGTAFKQTNYSLKKDSAVL